MPLDRTRIPTHNTHTHIFIIIGNRLNIIAHTLIIQSHHVLTIVRGDNLLVKKYLSL